MTWLERSGTSTGPSSSSDRFSTRTSPSTTLTTATRPPNQTTSARANRLVRPTTTQRRQPVGTRHDRGRVRTPRRNRPTGGGTRDPELTEALQGRFSEHHAFLARTHLDLIDQRTTAIEKVTARIEVMMEPFRGFHDLICSIPGISTLTADVVVAETRADMTRVPSAKHLASWAGTTPGNNESAGRVESSKTRLGNPYRQGARGAAAIVCASHPQTYLGAKYRRIATRRVPMKGQRRDPARHAQTPALARRFGRFEPSIAHRVETSCLGRLPSLPPGTCPSLTTYGRATPTT